MSASSVNGHTVGSGASQVPFVRELRSRPGVLELGDQPNGDTLRLRVEMPEVWDVIRVDASPDEPVLALKVNALAVLAPGALFQDDFVIKLRGIEIIDETQSLKAAGATDGSIFLLSHRRRRPVR